MSGAEPRYNEPQYNGILDITNTNQKPKLKIYPDITNKCHHLTEITEGKQINRGGNFCNPIVLDCRRL